MALNKQALIKVAREFQTYHRNEYFLDKYSRPELNALKKTNAIEPGNSAKLLNKLLYFYEKIKPEWVKVYNDNEENKDQVRALSSPIVRDYFSVKLNEGTQISEFYSNNDGKDDNKNFEDFARIIHISNKIAHEFEDRAKSNVIEIIKSDRTGELSDLFDGKNLDKDFWFDLFKNTTDSTTVFFQNLTLPEVTTYVKERIRNPRSEKCKIARREIELKTQSSEYGKDYLKELKKLESLDYLCSNYRIEYSGLQKLSADGLLYMASKSYRYGMSIKDDYLTILPAYSSKRTIEGPTVGYEGNVVYIDLPGYGNFSVHMSKTNIRKAGYSKYPFKFDEKDTRREPLVILPMKDNLKEYFNECKNETDFDEEYGISKYSGKAKQLFRTAHAVLDLELTRKPKNESLEQQIRISQSLRHHLGVLAGLPPYMLKFIRAYDSVVLKNPDKDPFDIEETFLQHLSKKMPTIERNLSKYKTPIRGIFLSDFNCYRFKKPGKMLKNKRDINSKNNTEERNGRDD